MVFGNCCMSNKPSERKADISVLESKISSKISVDLKKKKINRLILSKTLNKKI